MGLFGNKADKQARATAAREESERLRGLSTRELAAEVLPAFGPGGIDAGAGHRQGAMEVVSWLLPDAPVKYRQPILGPVIEALGVLESEQLLSKRAFGSGQSATYGATRVGTDALADGSVRDKLGLG